MHKFCGALPILFILKKHFSPIIGLCEILTLLRYRKDATSFRYYGDGTGRDSYMLRDYGGLVCDYSNENKTVGDFYKSLRSGGIS